MKQLTGLDASFLYMETGSQYGHVNALAIYERPDRPDFDAYRETYERTAALIGRLEPMRRRLLEVPFQLDHPYWVADAELDLEYHIRHIGLAPPGGADQLAEQVARIIARPMDRSRPLWETYVIEGLGDGRFATLSKTHHATIDGAAGVIMMDLMMDKTPDAPQLEEVPWETEPVPSSSELMWRTMAHLAANPIKGMRLSLRLVRSAADALGLSSVSSAAGQGRSLLKQAVGGGGDGHESERASLPLTPAPPTPFNHPVSPHRRFAMRSTSLRNIKALKDATGGTVNDIVMAICTGALREYLIRHDALPDAPLRAMVPVSVRTGLEEDPWTNRVSSIVADLPTNEPDPLERVRLCHDAMNAAKRQMDLLPADSIIELADFALPLVATTAMRLQSRLKLSERVNLPFNVVISNVPGPREQLYFAGAKLTNYIPVSTITDAVGLNITVYSYMDHLDFGLVACRDLIPDLWDLVDLHVDEVARLFEATGAEWVDPPKEASWRRGDPLNPAEFPQPAVEKAPAKKTAAKKTPAKKTAAKKTPAKKTAARKAPAKKAAARTAAARKAPAKKAAAKGA